MKTPTLVTEEEHNVVAMGYVVRPTMQAPMAVWRRGFSACIVTLARCKKRRSVLSEMNVALSAKSFTTLSAFRFFAFRLV